MSDHGLDTSVEILLVEDNPGDVRLTQEAFELADVETTLSVVPDGDQALEFLSRRRITEGESVPDLVLLDLNLPRMGGLAVLEAIRDDPTLSRIPVLVLTSSKDRSDILESYGLHANAYLTKPTKLEEFVALVGALEQFWFERAQLPPLP